jgi:hypothetical protein
MIPDQLAGAVRTAGGGADDWQIVDRPEIALPHLPEPGFLRHRRNSSELRLERPARGALLGSG